MSFQPLHGFAAIVVVPFTKLKWAHWCSCTSFSLRWHVACNAGIWEYSGCLFFVCFCEWMVGYMIKITCQLLHVQTWKKGQVWRYLSSKWSVLTISKLILKNFRWISLRHTIKLCSKAMNTKRSGWLYSAQGFRSRHTACSGRRHDIITSKNAKRLKNIYDE